MKKELLNQGQTTIGFLLDKTGSNRPADMIEFTVPAGAKVPVTYYHEELNETAYGLERVVSFTIEAKAIDISPGERHFVPRDAIREMALYDDGSNYYYHL